MIFHYAPVLERSHFCPRCGSRRVSEDGYLAQHILGRLLRCSWCGFYWGEPEVDA